VRLKDFARQPSTLPDYKVCILNRQLCEWRRLVFDKSSIKRSHFLDEHTHGPAITDDVMHRHQQDMIFSAETHEARTYEWSSREIERQARLFRRASLGFVLSGNINQTQIEYECWSNRLHRLCVDRRKTRAQTFVPADDFIQRSLHRIDLQVTM
jgi:hypothetical protein